MPSWDKTLFINTSMFSFVRLYTASAIIPKRRHTAEDPRRDGTSEKSINYINHVEPENVLLATIGRPNVMPPVHSHGNRVIPV